MSKEKKEKPTSVDALLDELRETTSEDHEKTIKAYEAYTHPNEILRRHNKIIKPAFDGTSKGGGAYNNAIDKIDEITDEIKEKDQEQDEVEITEEDHIHKILNAYMSEALSKLHPKMMENIKDDLEELEEKDKYDKLSALFDGLLENGEKGETQKLSGIVKSLKKGKHTAGDLKTKISGWKEGHIKAVSNYLIAHAETAYLSSLPPGVFGKYVLDKLEKKGYEFEKPVHKVEFLSNPGLYGKVHGILKSDEEKEKKKRLHDIEGLVYKKAA